MVEQSAAGSRAASVAGLVVGPSPSHQCPPLVVVVASEADEEAAFAEATEVDSAADVAEDSVAGSEGAMTAALADAVGTEAAEADSGTSLATSNTPPVAHGHGTAEVDAVAASDTKAVAAASMTTARTDSVGLRMGQDLVGMDPPVVGSVEDLEGLVDLVGMARLEEGLGEAEVGISNEKALVGTMTATRSGRATSLHSLPYPTCSVTLQSLGRKVTLFSFSCSNFYLHRHVAA